MPCLKPERCSTNALATSGSRNTFVLGSLVNNCLLLSLGLFFDRWAVSQDSQSPDYRNTQQLSSLFLTPLMYFPGDLRSASAKSKAL